MMSRRSLFDGLGDELKKTGAAFTGSPVIVPRGRLPIPPSTNRRDFPNTELITHDGRTVRFYDDLVKGKIVLFNFFYARCEGVCIPTTTNLAKVQSLLGPRVGRDMFMYSITLKPKEDRPADLKAYSIEHRAKPGWTFLTGTPENCDLIRRRLGFADTDPVRDADPTQHSGLLVFGNEPYDRYTACPALANPKEIAKAVFWVDWP